ncbi:unnamed protein product, partial [Brassica rapa]
DVCGCPSAHTGHLCVSVSTHRISVAVRVCPSAHTGRPWLSISTHISTLVFGLSPLTLLVDCLGNFGPHGLSFSTLGTSMGVRQHTQDIHGCLCVSVCVRQHTQDVRGCMWLSTSVAARVCPSAHTGRPWLPISTHISTQDVCGCPSAHIGRPCVSVSTHRMSVAVCVCPSAHTGRLWLSISTHISTLVLGLSMLALPVDCLGDFGPRGLSVQYTQDVR